MTDEQLDRMVRDADPYRPDTLGSLDDSRDALLNEIMAKPVLTRVVKMPRAPRGALRYIAGAVATVAVLASVFTVSAGLRGRSGDRGALPADVSVAAGAPSSGPTSPPAPLRAPRLMIDAPGWTPFSVYGFTGTDGSLSYQNGAQKVELTWYASDQYASYYTDRLEVSAPQAVTVDRWPGSLFQYSSDDFAVMLNPRDGTFVEMRTSGGWTRALFDQILKHVVRVNVRTWLAALPSDIVTPARAAQAATEVLADVPLPPGFDRSSLTKLGVNDPYQFGAEVTGRVGCGWISEWQRAEKAGDDSAQLRAATAMKGSHHWKVLLAMQDQGGWTQIFWEYADKVAAGHRPDGYESGLGCA
jgi:hypothetical protein